MEINKIKQEDSHEMIYEIVGKTAIEVVNTLIRPEIAIPYNP